MATVPNMNVAPMVPQVGLPPAVDGEGGDLFASLLPIVAGISGSGQVAPSQVTSGGAAIGASIIRGIVPGQNLGIDFHAAAAGTEGGEPGDGGTVDSDEASPLLPETDFLPILQAQNGFPVTVTTVSVSAPKGSEARPSSAPQPFATPPAILAQSNTVVSLPLVGPAGGPPADGEPAAQDPAIAVAIRQVVQSLKGREPEAGAESAKAAAKGDVVQPMRKPETAGMAGPAPTTGGIGKDVATERSGPVEKAAASAPAPIQAPVVQPPSAPTVITPTTAAIDPAASLAPPRPEAAAPQSTSGGEAAITRELDLAHESEWLDGLARDIARTGANDGPMRFRLNPNTLGHLQVELAQGDQGTSIRLTVETEAARTILTDAQPRLMAEARAQGVRIAQSEIDLSGNGHQASGDPRRHQEDARQTVMIRTARGPDGEAAAAATPVQTRADRYA